jgi:hypothetical protein
MAERASHSSDVPEVTEMDLQSSDPHIPRRRPSSTSRSRSPIATVYCQVCARCGRSPGQENEGGVDD